MTPVIIKIYSRRSENKKSRIIKINTRINSLFKRQKNCRILLDQRVNKLSKKTRKHSSKLTGIIFKRICALEHDVKVLEEDYNKRIKEIKEIKEKKRMDIEQFENKKKIFIDFCEHINDKDYLTKNFLTDECKDIYFSAYNVSILKDLEILGMAEWKYTCDGCNDQYTTLCPSIYDFSKYMKIHEHSNCAIIDIDIYRLFRSEKLKNRELYFENNKFYYKFNPFYICVFY